MRRSKGTPKAFTLLEILLTLSIIGLIAGIALNNIEGLLAAVQVVPIEQRFRDIATEARLIALERKTRVEMTFNTGSGRFELKALETPAASAPADRDSDPKDHEESPAGNVFMEASPSSAEYRYDRVEMQVFPVVSLETLPARGSVTYASTPVSTIAFEPTGLGTPCRVVFRFAKGDPLELTLDAFSSGPLPQALQRP